MVALLGGKGRKDRPPTTGQPRSGASPLGLDAARDEEAPSRSRDGVADGRKEDGSNASREATATAGTKKSEPLEAGPAEKEERESTSDEEAPRSDGPEAKGGPEAAAAEGGSREERLEEEIRVLRTEIARLESSLEEQTAARRRMEQEVRSLADHDPLTGLASERRFADRLSVAIVHAQRYEQKLAVVQLGIDNFKDINDRLGRSLGDDALKSIALALESTLRQGDTISRFEGDVFTILLPGLKQDEDMTVIADKLRLALRSPFSIGGHDLLLTASLGVALFPEDGPSVESLLHNATVALKRAKERGGDSWDVHAPRSRALAAVRQARESALRRALAQNDLELFWQPVVECETGAIVGVEALLRWENPRGPKSHDYISLADVAGLAVPLGHWTLRAACRQANDWHQAGHQGLVVSVNVSERQLHHPALLKLVRRVLDETSLPPACLELEISEREIRRHPERTVEQLAQLRELGLRIALDGFGTGESRLGYLYRLPIDTLKIDPSVVAEAISSHDQEAVITAAVALARSRKLRVVAGGVETEAQRVLLVRWQCDRMQGTLCGPPLSAIETEQLLLRQRKAGRALAFAEPEGTGSPGR